MQLPNSKQKNVFFDRVDDDDVFVQFNPLSSNNNYDNLVYDANHDYENVLYAGRCDKIQISLEHSYCKSVTMIDVGTQAERGCNLDADELLSIIIKEHSYAEPSCLKRNISTQLSTTYKYHDELKCLKCDINEMKLTKCNEIIDQYSAEKNVLKEKLDSKKLNLLNLNSDYKSNYFTGISSKAVLLEIFKFLEDDLIPSKNKIITKEEMFLLTLKRLRLNQQLQTIAFDLNLSVKTISFYFSRTLYTLYINLKGLIKWPSRNVLKKHMPSCFKKVYDDKVTIIIDCFEIRMQQPSTQLGSCNVYSNYKNANTIKILIGISPSRSDYIYFATIWWKMF